MYCSLQSPAHDMQEKKLNYAHDLLIRSLDLLNRAHDLLIRSLDLLNRAHDLLFRSLDL